MFCPNCGQERTSTETSFCSRCGFLLTGAAELMQTGGMILRATTGEILTSPRRKGLKQGLFIFLLTFLVVPIVSIFTIAIRVEPFAVAICAVALLMGGLLRMAYALMFESTISPGAKNEPSTVPHNFMPPRPVGAALPPQSTFPAQAYAAPPGGNWRDTNDLEPKSVTEGTTRLLENEEIPQ